MEGGRGGRAWFLIHTDYRDLCALWRAARRRCVWCERCVWRHCDAYAGGTGRPGAIECVDAVIKNQGP